MNSPAAKVSRVDPDGFAAALLLSMLATAGFFYVSVMPALVSGLITALNFSPSLAGRVASCNVYGAAAGAFFAALIVRSVSWRQAAVSLLGALMLMDLLSIVTQGPFALASLRLLHGIAGGLLVGITYGVMSRTARPERCFGVLMIVQSLLGGLGSMFLPRLVPSYGIAVLFVAFIALSAIALALLPLLPSFPVQPRSTSRPQGARAANSWYGLSLALAAIFLFQTGNFAVNGYLIEVGRANGFTLTFITGTLGLAHSLAILGALLAVLIGTRFGRLLPIGVGIGTFLLGTLAFQWGEVPAVFAAACISTAIAVFFVIPYLLGLCAGFDRSGRAAALAGLFSKLGIASGPLLSATVLATGAFSYAAVINAAIACIAASAVAGIMSTQAESVTL